MLLSSVINSTIVAESPDESEEGAARFSGKQSAHYRDLRFREIFEPDEHFHSARIYRIAFSGSNAHIHVELRKNSLASN
jgi:hypothetical protein